MAVRPCCIATVDSSLWNPSTLGGAYFIISFMVVSAFRPASLSIVTFQSLSYQSPP